MRWFLLLLFFTGVVNCAGPGAGSSLLSSRELIDSLVIRNGTAEEILNVELRVPETSILISYNRILPGIQHELDFEPRENQRRQAYLSWTHRGAEYSKPIDSVIPQDLDPERLYQVVVIVGDRGQLAAQVLPE